jgi:hypothetical protein
MLQPLDGTDDPIRVFLRRSVSQRVEHIDPDTGVCVVDQFQQPIPDVIDVLLNMADAQVLDCDSSNSRTRARRQADSREDRHELTVAGQPCCLQERVRCTPPVMERARTGSVLG